MFEMTEHYDTADIEKPPIIRICLGREGLNFIQTLIEEQDKCKNCVGLLQMLDEQFKLQYHKTVLSLQYCKILRDIEEIAEEWMGHLRLKVKECDYQE